MPEASPKKVDLHAHTVFSSFRHLKVIRARDSYNDPLAVYERCREIGCDYVAITDHDTIDGALDLLSRRPELEPMVIVGEEVETVFPETGMWAHVNVFGVDERIHEDLVRVKGDVRDLVAYLREKRLLHVLNHPLQSYRMQRSPQAFVESLLELFTHVEVGNGTLPPAQNAAAAGILGEGRRRGIETVGVGGSDAHGLRPLGAFVTVAEGEDKASWLDAVAKGRCTVAGKEIGFLRLVGEVYGQVGRYYRWVSSPEGREEMGALGWAAAASLVPACLAGWPLAQTAISWGGTSGLSGLVSTSLGKAAATSPLQTAWPDAAPELSEKPEG